MSTGLVTLVMVIMMKSMMITVLWYKYYSGGWCTWPTPLKYPESKSNEA